MSRVAQSYWTDSRIRSQRVLPRTAPTLPTVRELSIEIIGTPAEVRRRGGIIPSWVIVGMIMLATFSVCVTVTVRSYGEVNGATSQLSRMQQDVESLRRGNATLQNEIQRLSSDSKAIESAARVKLNMARANEIIVPIE
ncbi:MAG TPA: septum formation initiator family protein [Pyrinomonadaceae bacterium]|nr:septum formation initiator family protein [Pyrinomonadaceae bacterium]